MWVLLILAVGFGAAPGMYGAYRLIKAHIAAKQQEG